MVASMDNFIQFVVADMVLLLVDDTDDFILIDFCSEDATKITDKASNKLKLSTATTRTRRPILAEPIKNL